MPARRPTVSPLRVWLMASRPRTLPAAIAPVLGGSAAAYYVADDLRVLAEDEGHGFGKKSNQNAQQEATVLFLQKIIGK